MRTTPWPASNTPPPIGDLAIQPGLLAIYHLTRTPRLTAPARAWPREGSDGPTLNLTIDARYRLNDAWTLELAYGSPMVVRDERPDGLTRSLVLNLALAYRFGTPRE
ncbi:MAG: hypothetical protein R2810_04675 [Flavobacteriales bacterium]